MLPVILSKGSQSASPPGADTGDAEWECCGECEAYWLKKEYAMDVFEAIGTRKSVRAFKSLPVPREVLSEVLEISLRAPSCENTQPWGFAIVTGRVLDELKETLGEKRGADEEFRPDIPFPLPTYRPPYVDRGKEVGRGLFQAMEIDRHDMNRRMVWYQSMARFFDAPVGLIVYVERYLGSYAVFDAGLFVENLALAALHYGLGTSIHMAGVLYPDVLRRMLNIPESKLILCGVSIGYPDKDHPSWRFRSRREPLETFASWHGFDEEA